MDPNQKLVQDLKKKIYKSRPIFGRIVEKHGKKSLYDYSKQFLDINHDPNLDSRRPICLNVVKKEVEKRLGKEVAEQVERQLLKIPMVSTMDHHAFIDHPFWVNAQIVTALPYKEAKMSALKFLITFSFASVSLNNASGFPRGILFHGGERGEGPIIRLPILPDKWKMRTVYGTPTFTKEDLERAKKQLDEKQREGLIGKERVQKIHEKVFSEFEKEDILASEDLCQQITKLNYRFWPQYFAGGGMPDLIYIEAETMVREILVQEALQDQDCLIAQILFNKKVRKTALKYFEGIPGTFSTKDKWGTYFFWMLDEKGHRVSLWLEDEKLVSKNKNLEVEMTPEGITKALKEMKIFPSMMMIYLTLSLHYGFKCLGGFSQVHDLTEMKSALLHTLVDLEKFKEIHSVCRIQTKEFGGDGMVLAYIENEKKELAPAMGIDMLISDRKKTLDQYQQMSKEFTFEEIITPMLPEIFTVLYPTYMREGTPDEKLTTEDVTKATGLGEKIYNVFKKISS